MVFIKVLIIINISITYIWFHQPKMSIIPFFMNDYIMRKELG